MGKYTRKTTRQSWSQNAMRDAMRDVQYNGRSVHSASKQFAVPEATLRRYIRKYGDNQNFPQHCGRFKTTFTEQQLLELKNYIVEVDQRAFGVTRKQFAKIVFDYAEYHNIDHRFNVEKKKAGREFCENFRKRFNISLRTPESTSIARLMAFNKENIDIFFNTLKDLRLKYNYSANQIYNCDETGISTVPTKTPKILTPKGKRRVIKVSSAERGSNVTALCCINAIGTFIPPMLIFPRVRMQPAFMNGAPAGSLGVAHETGWMTTENFIKYLHHPVLLLMDNHATHVNLEAINLCRENYITLLGFPAHTSHRMQPLDVSFFGPLKTAYSVVCENFLVNNPGRTITIHDIAYLFGQAYLKAASLSNAINGFKACGIEPFDSNIFSDLDFMAAKTTDKPLETQENFKANTVLQVVENIPTKEANPNKVQSSTSNSKPNSNEKQYLSPLKTQENSKGSTVLQAIENISNIPTGEANLNIVQPSTSKSKPNSNKKQHLTPPSNNGTGLPLLPVAEVKKSNRRRKKLHSLIISSTPVKTALEVIQEEKLEKERKKKLRQLAKKKKIENTKLQKASCQKRKTQTVKRKVLSSSSESSGEFDVIDTEDEMDSINSDDDDRLCIICDDAGKNKELWYMCAKCRKWAHAACSGLAFKEAKAKQWLCDFCQ